MSRIDEIEARADKGYWETDGVDVWVSDMQMLADIQTLLAWVKAADELAAAAQAWKDIDDDTLMSDVDAIIERLEHAVDEYKAVQDGE